MKPFQKRKPPTIRKCDEGCPCHDAGFIDVLNEGQFKTANGNVLRDNVVTVLCNGSKGEWIRLHSSKLRLPTYDPESMTLPGEDEPRSKPKPQQAELF